MVNVLNLILGPADLYIGPFGAPEPADSDVASAPNSMYWASVGGTNGGVKVNISQAYKSYNVLGIKDVVQKELLSRSFSVTTVLAEGTLLNLATALNSGSASSSSLVNTYDPSGSIISDDDNYAAIILDGWSPEQRRRRIIVRKVLQTGGVSLDYEKQTQLGYPAAFEAHYVSSATLMFHMCDDENVPTGGGGGGVSSGYGSGLYGSGLYG